MTIEEELAEQERTNKQFIEFHLKLLGGTFDQARATANLFILAGYGSFFGLWSVTRDRLHGSHTPIWAALLMLISVTSFAVFQVWAVLHMSMSQWALARELSKAENLVSVEKIQATVEENAAAARRRAPGLFIVWVIFFLVTIATGFGAIGVLGWGFVQMLWRTVPVH
jgi:hypothetical protein